MSDSSDDDKLLVITSTEDRVQCREDDPAPYMAWDGAANRVRYFIAVKVGSDVREIELNAAEYRDVLATLQLTVRVAFHDFLDGVDIQSVQHAIERWAARED